MVPASQACSSWPMACYGRSKAVYECCTGPWDDDPLRSWREVGLVAQQPGRMLAAATVREELDLGPRLMGRRDPVWTRRIADRFDLGPLLDRMPQRLSAGEQRRVALAAVLATRPRAVLLDEPTVGQDATGCDELRDELTACAGDGIAVRLATHATEWAATLACRWSVLLKGRIQADDHPAAVCTAPALMADARLAMPAAAALRLAYRKREAPDG